MIFDPQSNEAKSPGANGQLLGGGKARFRQLGAGTHSGQLRGFLLLGLIHMVRWIFWPPKNLRLKKRDLLCNQTLCLAGWTNNKSQQDLDTIPENEHTCSWYSKEHSQFVYPLFPTFQQGKHVYSSRRERCFVLRNEPAPGTQWERGFFWGLKLWNLWAPTDEWVRNVFTFQKKEPQVIMWRFLGRRIWTLKYEDIFAEKVITTF